MSWFVPSPQLPNPAPSRGARRSSACLLVPVGDFLPSARCLLPSKFCLLPSNFRLALNFRLLPFALCRVS